VLRWPWGRPWDLDAVREALAGGLEGGWVWGVHLETSTGVLNDLPGLVRLARAYDVRVCADCVSSLGAVPLDLGGVHLASGSTGKALGAYAGIAIVFADAAALGGVDPERVPSCLDVPATLATVGPRYTFSSPLLRALEVALDAYAAGDRFAEYAELGRRVRRRLREVGLDPLAPEEWAAPVITTFAAPGGASSEAFVARRREEGFEVGGESAYLAERRLVQVATMGHVARDEVDRFFDGLRRESRGAQGPSAL
jgi:aspartate aminotransferase-like enzyme